MRFSLRVIILILVSILINIPTVYADENKTYNEWRMAEKNGLGFGLGLGSMPGLILFYDRNLSEVSQLHIQLNSGLIEYNNLLGEKVIKVNRGMVLATYRYFPLDNGFYIGGGGGVASSTLEYNSTTTYSSKISGLFATGEVGWQGNDNYYFHIGYQPSIYLTSSDDFDVTKISNTSNHRSKANEGHDAAKQLGILAIGFGWFF